jgi:hypothetical protein
MLSPFVGYENITTLAHRDAVRRGHPLHHPSAKLRWRSPERVPQLETAGTVVSMSEKEFSRLSVLMDVQAGRLRIDDAARLLELKRRQVFRDR